MIEIKSCFAEVVVGVDSQGTVEIQKYTAGINEKPVVTLADFKCRFYFSHPAVKAFLGVKFSKSDYDVHTKKIVKSLVKNEIHRKVMQLQRSSDGLEFSEVTKYVKGLAFHQSCRIPIEWDLGLMVDPTEKRALLRQQGLRKKDITLSECRLLNHFLSQVASGIGGILKDMLDKNLFIGPLREVPQRIVCHAHPRHDEDLQNCQHRKEYFLDWANGAGAWAALSLPEFIKSLQQRKKLALFDKKLGENRKDTAICSNIFNNMFSESNDGQRFGDDLYAQHKIKHPKLPEPEELCLSTDSVERPALWKLIIENCGLSKSTLSFLRKVAQLDEDKQYEKIIKVRDRYIQQVTSRGKKYKNEKRELERNYSNDWYLSGSSTTKKENYHNVARVNSILDGLNFKYNLKLVERYEVGSNVLERNALRKLVLQAGSKKSRLATDAIDGLDSHYEIIFVERKSGTELRPVDLGIGVSQLMPIIIGASYDKALFSIQQPELHLHPALQCETADILLYSRSLSSSDEGYNLKFSPQLIETHSEHLILRFLRRIRETTKGLLETPEKEHLKLTPDEMSVLYVSEALDGLRVTPIQVDEQGELVDEWPGGFFEEGFNEIVGGL